MSDALALLALPHPKALQSLIQDVLVPGVSVSDLLFSPVSIKVDGQVSVGVYLSEQAHQNPANPYRGQVEFVYHRMDFATLFSGIDLSFTVPETLEVKKVVKKMSMIFKLDIQPEDYLNETLTLTQPSTVYVLRAHPLSPRYKGTVPLTLIRQDG